MYILYIYLCYILLHVDNPSRYYAISNICHMSQRKKTTSHTFTFPSSCLEFTEAHIESFENSSHFTLALGISSRRSSSSNPHYSIVFCTKQLSTGYMNDWVFINMLYCMVLQLYLQKSSRWQWFNQ